MAQFISRDAEEKRGTKRKYQPRDSAVRQYCLTINNWTAEDLDQAYGIGLDYCTYAIVGEEVGEKGTPHLQIYFRLTEKVRFSTIKSWFPNAHVEKSKGTCYDNFVYCSKEGNFHEFGQRPPVPASKSKDWQAMFDKALANKYHEIAAGDLIQHGLKLERAVALYLSSTPKVAREQLYNFIFTGPSGVGKSLVATMFGNLVYNKPEGKWYPNYRGQPIIYWEDVEPKDFTDNARFWKRALDHEPIQVEIKGGHVWSVPKVVYITSNYKLDDLLERVHVNDKGPLYRRLREHKYQGPPPPKEGKPYKDCLRHQLEGKLSVYNVIKYALTKMGVDIPEPPKLT